MARAPDRNSRPIPPLDAAALERLALRYVERFATTRGKLADYLRRKIRERGWAGEAADAAALADRLARLGYIDDRGYAEAKAAALARRGLGERRVAGALMQARIEEADRAAIAPAVADRAVEAALAFAKRKRLGPWGPGGGDQALRERQIGAMLRAGHRLELSRRILALPPGEEFDAADLG